MPSTDSLASYFSLKILAFEPLIPLRICNSPPLGGYGYFMDHTFRDKKFTTAHVADIGLKTLSFHSFKQNSDCKTDTLGITPLCLQLSLVNFSDCKYERIKSAYKCYS